MYLQFLKVDEIIEINSKDKNYKTQQNESLHEKKLLYNSSNILKEFFYHALNIILTLISYFIFLFLLSLILIMALPSKIISNVILIFFKTLLYSLNILYGSLALVQKICTRNPIRFILGIIFLIIAVFIFIIGTVIIMVIGNGFNLIGVCIVIFICIANQSILWPIIDSVKSLLIICSVIHNYYKDRRIDYNKVNWEADEHQNYTSSISQIWKENEKFLNNDYCETSSILEFNTSENNIIGQSEFKFIFKDPFYNENLIVPLKNVENSILLELIFKIWIENIRKTVKYCFRWWKFMINKPFKFYDFFSIKNNYYFWKKPNNKDFNIEMII